MEVKTEGTVVSAFKLWFITIRRELVRSCCSNSGAVHPYVVRLRYRVNGVEYRKTTWETFSKITYPLKGDRVKVFYQEEHPERCRVEF